MTFNPIRLLVLPFFVLMFLNPRGCKGQDNKTISSKDMVSVQNDSQLIYEIFSTNNYNPTLGNDVHGIVSFEGDTIYRFYKDSKLIEKGKIILKKIENLSPKVKVPVYEIHYLEKNLENLNILKFIPQSSWIYGYGTDKAFFTDNQDKVNSPYMMKLK